MAFYRSGGGVPSSKCTATAADVLAGKTYVGADTNNKLGTGTAYGVNKIYYLGTGTSFNIKSKFPQVYGKLTNANFIVELTSIPSVTFGPGGLPYGKGENAWTKASGISVGKSYNASTGVLTVSGGSQTVGTYFDWGGALWQGGAQSNATFKVYLVLGNIQNA